MAHTMNKREYDVGYDEFTVNWKAVNSKSVKSNYEKGSVVYFVAKYNNQYNVDYGIVVDCYSDYVCLQLIAYPDRRLANGIPYKDFPNMTEWRKLPKDFEMWDGVASVCEVKYDQKFFKDFVDISKPAEILRAYASGELVNVQDIDHSILQIDVDPRYGYRLRKGGDASWIYNSHYTCAGNNPIDSELHNVSYKHKTAASFVGLGYTQCFTNFYDAQENVEKFNELIGEQMNMTELEFAKKQIEYDIDKSIKLEDRQKAIEFFDNLEGLENIETRPSYNGVEWRKLGAKKWNTYPENEE